VLRPAFNISLVRVRSFQNSPIIFPALGRESTAIDQGLSSRHYSLQSSNMGRFAGFVYWQTPGRNCVYTINTRLEH